MKRHREKSNETGRRGDRRYEMRRHGKKAVSPVREKTVTSAGERALRLAEMILGARFYADKKAAAQIALLFPGKEGEKQVRAFYGRRVLRGAAIVLAAIILMAGMLAYNKTNGQTIEVVLRDSAQGVKREYLMIARVGETAQEVRLQVFPREYTDEEVRAALTEAKRDLDEVLRGENESILHLDKDLSFPSVLPGSPVSISWVSSNYQVIDSRGVLHEEALLYDGEPVEIRAKLSLQGVEEEKVWACRVYRRKKTGSEALSEDLASAVRGAEEATRTGTEVILPETIDGRKVIWEKKQDQSIWILAVLFLIGSVMLIRLDTSRLHAKMKERAGQLEMDYAEIVSRLMLLLGAGLTVPGAWERIVLTYKKEKRKKRYAYEEMSVSLNELKSGVPEAKVYEHFGQRCATSSYLKFSNMLNQNLRKGNKDLLKLFQKEAEEANVRRRLLAKQRGEEAGTKLLIPMFLMLVTVLIIVVMPAFMTMQL